MKRTTPNLGVCLKSLRPECGRPRPQQCTTSNRSRFLQHLSYYHVAAPDDGRTPSESVFSPKCVFRQALNTLLLCVTTLAVMGVSTLSRAAQVAMWGDNSQNQLLTPENLHGVKAIACGFYHNLALKSDGTVASWGGSVAAVPAGLSSVTAIAAGTTHSMALRADGSVVLWGDNSFGQATPLPGLSGVIKIAAGARHNMALRFDGTVVAWGDDSNGQTNVPSNLNNVVAISAAGSQCLAQRADGTLAAWGSGAFGQTNIPAGLSDVAAIAAGQVFHLALRSDGSVVAWGTYADSLTTFLAGRSNIIAMAAGFDTALFLQTDGSVLGWSNFTQMILPPGLTNVTAIAAGVNHNLALANEGPIEILAWPQSKNVISTSNATLTVIATGRNPLSYQWYRNGVALVESQRIIGVNQAALGINHYVYTDDGVYSVIVTNALGKVVSQGATLHAVYPPTITTQPTSLTVRAGTDAVFTTAVSGTLLLSYQWFFNGSPMSFAIGQNLFIGNVQPTNSGSYFMRVTNLYGEAQTLQVSLTVTDSPPYFVQQPYVRKPDQSIATNLVAPIGGSASILVTARGSEPLFYQWKFNGLAIPNSTNSTLTLSNLQYNQAGYYNVEVSNAFGSTNSAKFLLSVSQVVIAGTPFTDNFNTPSGLSNVIAVAAGGSHVMALRSDGTVRTWLADSKSVESSALSVTNIPASVTNVIAIAAGRDHCLALRSNGTVVAWGGNNNGQTSTPTTLSNVVSIAGGYSRSYAVKADGTITGWGISAYVPVGLSNVVAVAAGDLHNLALRRDGTVTSWGSGTLTNIPVGLSNVIAIAVGQNFSLVLRRDGTIAGWASAASGVPQNFTRITNVVAIAAGSTTTALALLADGTFISTGLERTPFPITNNITAIAAGGVQAGFGVAVVGNGSPSITLQPVSQIVQRSNTVQLHARAASVQPMRYQWLLDNLPLPGATNSSLVLSNILGKDTGNYQMIASNALGTATSQIAAITILFNTNLPAALNTTNVQWISTDRNSPWFVQNRETHDGDAAAQSGSTTNNGQSALQGSYFSGAGTLTFWWKVSSEEGFDYLRVFVDNSTIPVFSISGETGWEQRTITFTNGSHFVRWIYSKDGSVSAGRDAGWLDEVAFTPALPVANITPAIRTVSAGDNSSFFAVTTSDAKPVTYQWMRFGTNIANATNQTLSLLRAGRRDRGDYSVRVGNPGGSIVASNAVLRVIAPQRLGSAQRTQDGAMEIVSRDADDGTLLPQDLPLFEAQASTNLLSWETLPNVLSVTNDALLLRDTNVGRLPQRFYRIVEH